MKIYADSLFLLNCIIDYLLLLAAGKICSQSLKRWRMLLGAALGGLYAVAAVVWADYFAAAAAKIVAGLVTVAMAYGGQPRFWRTAGAFFAAAAAFGGAVYAALGLAGTPAEGGLFVPVSMRVLILSFSGCYALLSLIFKHRGGGAERSIVGVEIALGQHRLSMAALEDTGNELYDPTGGEKLIILEKAAAEELLGLKLPDEAAEVFMLLAQRQELKHRLRLLNFSSLGGSGLILCLRCDEVRVEGKVSGKLVGITPRELSPSGEYRAII